MMHPVHLRRVCLLVALAFAGLAHAALPPVRHVFVLVLENKSFSHTFAPESAAPYLSRELPARGALLREYHGIGHYSLDNYLALISGQAPNYETQMDCQVFSEFQASRAVLDRNGQLHGAGCVYPKTVRTLTDQLKDAGLTWRAYMQDMGKNPDRERATCAHVPVGTPENTDAATAADQYATKHNPFVYFHSVIDDLAYCDAHVVNLDLLPQDLADASRTPNFVFITPNLCSDGHDDPCADGSKGGLAAIDSFLRHWVPQIEASPAFQRDGLLVITFDESSSISPAGSTACCGEHGLPGAKYPPGLNGPGGGRIGAVVLSPFVKPGTVSERPYNHYALLRTVEQLFGLAPLGYAGAVGVKAFGPDVFSAAAAPRPPAQ
ncbi:MAG: phosphoesterase [Proteobacteria bacterium]|nr:phosphoesterase [Pseudomonadota bacterium]